MSTRSPRWITKDWRRIARERRRRSVTRTVAEWGLVAWGLRLVLEQHPRVFEREDYPAMLATGVSLAREAGRWEDALRREGDDLDQTVALRRTRREWLYAATCLVYLDGALRLRRIRQRKDTAALEAAALELQREIWRRFHPHRNGEEA